MRDDILTVSEAEKDSDKPTTVTMVKLTQLLGQRLRNALLDQLRELNDASLPAKVAEQRLSCFFNFAIECVKEGLSTNEDILTLFEDLYECC